MLGLCLVLYLCIMAGGDEKRRQLCQRVIRQLGAGLQLGEGLGLQLGFALGVRRKLLLVDQDEYSVSAMQGG